MILNPGSFISKEKNQAHHSKRLGLLFSPYKLAFEIYLFVSGLPLSLLCGWLAR